jgi:hypothetical protein
MQFGIIERDLIGKGCEQRFGIPAGPVTPFEKEGTPKAIRCPQFLA